MSYAQSVLQPGETTLIIGRLHWIIYAHAILCFVVGVFVLTVEALFIFNEARRHIITITGVVFMLGFLVSFIYAWFIRWITEFAVTNRRVISSRVFIARRTEEMSMDKIETVDIDQSVLGRILGYGTLRITGTGGTNNIEQRRLAQPFALRNAVIAK